MSLWSWLFARSTKRSRTVTITLASDGFPEEIVRKIIDEITLEIRTKSKQEADTEILPTISHPNAQPHV